MGGPYWEKACPGSAKGGTQDKEHSFSHYGPTLDGE